MKTELSERIPEKLPYRLSFSPWNISPRILFLHPKSFPHSSLCMYRVRLKYNPGETWMVSYYSKYKFYKNSKFCVNNSLRLSRKPFFHLLDQIGFDTELKWQKKIVMKTISVITPLEAHDSERVQCVYL